jgi:hypothetical protein
VLLLSPWWPVRVRSLLNWWASLSSRRAAQEAPLFLTPLHRVAQEALPPVHSPMAMQEAPPSGLT